MEKTIPEQMKEVSHQYYRGFIDLPHYQQQRSALIDRFVMSLNGENSAQMPAMGQGFGLDFLFGKEGAGEQDVRHNLVDENVLDNVILEDAITGNVVEQFQSEQLSVSQMSSGVVAASGPSLPSKENFIEDVLIAADALSKSNDKAEDLPSVVIAGKKPKRFGSTLLLVVSAAMIVAAISLFYLMAI